MLSVGAKKSYLKTKRNFYLTKYFEKYLGVFHEASLKSKIVKQRINWVSFISDNFYWEKQ